MGVKVESRGSKVGGRKSNRDQALDFRISTPNAYLTEVFSSVQGEGPYVGERQIFVRFYGCHLQCGFCDTPETVTARHPKGFQPAVFRLEKAPGCRDFSLVPNPLAPEELLQILLQLDSPRGLHHSISLTGGEPLLHARFLQSFLPLLKVEGFRVYLETAGDLHRALKPLIGWVDIVAMDLKLPSVTNDRPRWQEHETFLRLCVESGVEVFTKVILSAETDPAEVERAARLVAQVEPGISLILQPMTPFGEAQNPPHPAQLLEWQALACQFLSNVRVIPQCHKVMGQL